ALPYLNSELGWEDRAWGATEHGFRLLLERYVRPGDRVLEIGAAKSWASQHLVPRGCEYVACDLLVDPVIGLGRGAFFERRAVPYHRIQADGERLPFADATFDVAFCVATLHHALDLHAMVGELARVSRAASPRVRGRSRRAGAPADRRQAPTLRAVARHPLGAQRLPVRGTV